MSVHDLEWETLPAGLRSEFVSRMTARLPELDPEAEWANMSVQGRRDLRWGLEHTEFAKRDAWSAECERIARAADAATGEAFRLLAEMDQ